jgi:hypothetical protein
MRNEEWIGMLRLIPEDQRNQTVIVMQNGMEVVVDTIFRFEPNYLVLRGRQTGNTDEMRAFFIPYDQMLYYRLERVVKLDELYRIYGEEPPASAYEDALLLEESAAAPVSEQPAGSPAPATMLAGGNGAVAPDTAGTVARNNLLARIRAARATSAGPGRQNTR